MFKVIALCLLASSTFSLPHLKTDKQERGLFGGILNNLPMNWFNSQEIEDNIYIPSKFTLMVATEKKTDYKKQEYKDTYKGTKKILVFAADEANMTMANDKIFSTGNHPIETLLPMIHMRDAGFTFDIATVSGGPVVLEMWAYPTEDKNIINFHKEIRAEMESPKMIKDIKNLNDYVGIFIPGGHSPMINLPTSVALGKLLHEAHQKMLPTVVICHGPAALLATSAEGLNKEFAYDGYELMSFSDKTDAFSPSLGYMPGQLKWKLQEALEKKGAKTLNTEETGATHQDRELITGDSPYAASPLGIMAAPILVKYANDNNL